MTHPAPSETCYAIREMPSEICDAGQERIGQERIGANPVLTAVLTAVCGP